MWGRKQKFFFIGFRTDFQENNRLSVYLHGDRSVSRSQNKGGYRV